MSIRLKTILTLLAVAAFAVVLAAQAGAATKKVAVAPGSPVGATPVASSTPDLTPAAIDAGTKAVGMYRSTVPTGSKGLQDISTKKEDK